METLILSIEEKNKNNPAVLAKLIIEAEQNLVDAKGNLDKLREKGFFNRMFSNNTKEIAEVIIKQNDTMGMFLYIVQIVVMQANNNYTVLLGIQENLTKAEKAHGKSSSEFMKVANKFMSSAVQNAKKAKLTDETIENIKSELLRKHETDNLQNTKIKEIAEELIQKKAKIAELESDLSIKKQIDEEQSLLLKMILQKENIELSYTDLEYLTNIKKIPDLQKSINRLKVINIVSLTALSLLSGYTIFNLVTQYM